MLEIDTLKTSTEAAELLNEMLSYYLNRYGNFTVVSTDPEYHTDIGTFYIGHIATINVDIKDGRLLTDPNEWHFRAQVRLNPNICYNFSIKGKEGIKRIIEINSDEYRNRRYPHNNNNQEAFVTQGIDNVESELGGD